MLMNVIEYLYCASSRYPLRGTLCTGLYYVKCSLRMNRFNLLANLSTLNLKESPTHMCLISQWFPSTVDMNVQNRWTRFNDDSQLSTANQCPFLNLFKT